ncbi:MAG: radical SAM protein [Deltaproteobacteria bacterium]|nr:radical SAM protein [Deltaproteobacteria bacterium]
MKESQISLLRSPSHLYVEREARGYPLCELLLGRFKGSEIVEVDSYKEVFNRFKQNWRLQKLSPKLILGCKRGELMYRTGEFVPNFKFENAYYCSQVLNCLYDCSYCFLQGMYQSANMVVFVNDDDFHKAADNLLERIKQLYLCISYDADLLALEGVLPLCKRWIEHCHRKPELHIEIRTKSANYSAISSCEPCERVVLAWTLSPSEICSKFERGAAPLAARLNAIGRALAGGWQVRICFDPVIPEGSWQEGYSELMNELFALPHSERIKDISIGGFRMNAEHFKRLSEKSGSSPVVTKEYLAANGKIALNEKSASKIKGFFQDILKSRFDSERVTYLFG